LLISYWLETRPTRRVRIERGRVMENFWEGQAKKYGYDVKAVNFDPVSEDLEVNFLKKMVGENEVVCDLGCGNGRTLLEIAKDKKDTMFYGVDFIEEMIKAANEEKERLGVRNVCFKCADATSEDMGKMFDFKFDMIMTKRLLINLKGDSKYKAVRNIFDMLKDGGKYIMVECFSEPLGKINDIRKMLGLDEIKVKDFNEYLSLAVIKNIKELFDVEEKIDFQSLYYFISRVFNAYLSEGDPIYDSPLNMLAADLIKNGINLLEGYSPEVIYVLRRRPLF
jgi:ubiquinone/menaquinone biosynthesis C-methylase UbiE